jgi:hypothetical protein
MPAHDRGRKRYFRGALVFREGWKIILGQGRDFVVRSLALHRDKAFLVVAEEDVRTGRKHLHDVVKLPRREGGGAAFLDPGRTDGLHGYIEVRGGEGQRVIRSDQERVGKNRNRSPAIDDSLNNLKISHKVFTANSYFHGLLSEAA